MSTDTPQERLTEDQIEGFRIVLRNWLSRDSSATQAKWEMLCDMALEALHSEKVKKAAPQVVVQLDRTPAQSAEADNHEKRGFEPRQPAVAAPDECGGGWNVQDGPDYGKWECFDCKAERPEGCRFLPKRTDDKSELSWQDAALAFGENLARLCPNGYYAMSPAEWMNWCLARVIELKRSAKYATVPTGLWPIGYIERGGSIAFEPGREPGNLEPGKLVYIIRNVDGRNETGGKNG